MFVFNQWRENERAQKIILSAIVIMFFLSTAHLGGTIQSLQEAFFDGRPSPPELYFDTKALPLNLYNKTVYGLNVLIGDLLMIYRLYIVAGGNIWYIIAPTLSLLGTCAITFTTIWQFSQLKPGQTSFIAEIKRLVPALFILPFVTNVLITGLIVYRILQAQRRVRDLESPDANSLYRRLLANVIESGLLYPSTLMITLILFIVDSNGQSVLTGSMTQVVTLVPTLMWLQVRLGCSQYDEAERRIRTANNQSGQGIVFGRPTITEEVSEFHPTIIGRYNTSGITESMSGTTSHQTSSRSHKVSPSESTAGKSDPEALSQVNHPAAKIPPEP
ncbi:hypothetical protein AX16_000735 [Volvariella volvacea WC 439]|nr:hypothetical protein AX16_000735 [Volvariella volvacea WC 439]